MPDGAGRMRVESSEAVLLSVSIAAFLLRRNLENARDEAAGSQNRQTDLHKVVAGVGTVVIAQTGLAAGQQIGLHHSISAVRVETLQQHRLRILAVAGINVVGK